MLQVREKAKSVIVVRVENMAKFFHDNPKRVISKQEIASKFFGSGDFATCAVVTSGYIPLVYKELQIHYKESLRNFRGRGWQLTTGGIDAFLAADPFERKWRSYKNSLAAKIELFDLAKWPKLLRILAVSIKIQIKAIGHQMDAVEHVWHEMRDGAKDFSKSSGNGDKAKKRINSE
ncbi:hypothetical protein ES703_22553 [subsurface metagenome]